MREGEVYKNLAQVEEDFKAGLDPYQERANREGITREEAKLKTHTEAYSRKDLNGKAELDK